MDEQPVPRHAEQLKGMYSSMEVGQSVVFVNWKKKAVDLANGCEAAFTLMRKNEEMKKKKKSGVRHRRCGRTLTPS